MPTLPETSNPPWNEAAIRRAFDGGNPDPDQLVLYLKRLAIWLGDTYFSIASTINVNRQDYINVADSGGFSGPAVDSGAAIISAIRAASELEYGGVVNLGGKEWFINETISLDDIGAYNVEIANGKISPTDSFTSGPLIEQLSGAGNNVFRHVFFNGKNPAGTRVADGFHQTAGQFTLSHCRLYDVDTYGVKVEGGNDGSVEFCRLRQTNLGDSDDDDGTGRTARLLWFLSGDHYITHCSAHHALYPAVFEGAIVQVNNSHFWNGATPASTQAAADIYNVLLNSTSSNVKFNDCYFDRGAVKMEGRYYHSFNGCQFLTDDQYTGNARFFEFHPQGAGEDLSGFNCTGSHMTGDLNSGVNPLASDNFFHIDTTSGTITGAENVHVHSNAYHKGQAPGVFVPTTNGSVHLRVEPGDWTSASGAYRTPTVDLDEYMFLPDIIGYKLTTGYESRGTAPHNMGDIRYAKNSGVFQFWSDTNPDASLHVAWDGSTDETIAL